ncbi:MAG: bifunctional phosphoglucose/phosphomannose isomerase [Firmicutes bacterium]|nr:bifunctional phosphoglucose/phosphomannose isomerase [Bacillota bacterium]
MMQHVEPELQLLLDDIDKMSRLDPGGILNLVAGFSGQLQEALRISANVRLPEDLGGLRNIVTAGLGGSGISGDVVRELISHEVKVPMTAVRGYDLPAFVSRESLVFISSYSGNTEETLSAYEVARKRGARVICVTSGGRLLEAATSDDVPVVVVPCGLPPRCALAYLATPILVSLGSLGYIEDRRGALEEAAQLIEDLTTVVHVEAPASVNQAKRMALAMYGKVPLIYGSSGITSVAALRWKTQINENSKAHAFWNVFPELNHNEVVGWTARPDISRGMHVVLLRDKEDDKRVERRMEITKELMAEASGVSEVFSHGKTKEARLLSLIHIGDFVSLYLAFLYNQDPEPIKAIDYLKDRLANQNDKDQTT